MHEPTNLLLTTKCTEKIKHTSDLKKALHNIKNKPIEFYSSLPKLSMESAAPTSSKQDTPCSHIILGSPLKSSSSKKPLSSIVKPPSASLSSEENVTQKPQTNNPPQNHVIARSGRVSVPPERFQY